MMGRCQEFIGVRCIEAANVYGEGQHLYNMHLTDTEIIRCRDCKGTEDGPWHKCETFLTHDENPDGFCAWAVRRDG